MVIARSADYLDRPLHSRTEEPLLKPSPARSAAPAAAPSPTLLGALGAILVAAAALRFHQAGLARLWFDEIYTLWVARLAPPDLLRTVAGDIHPPLHYLLVSAWRAAGGEGDLWIKSLSIVFGLGSIVAAWAFARRLAGERAGLVAAALLAVHRMHVAFSQESRSFMLLWMLLGASAFLAWRWTADARPRDAAWFVAASAAALYTHYLAGLVLAAQGAWGLVALRRDGRRALAWVGLHAAVALLFLPQLAVLREQFARLGADHWVRPPTPADAFNLLRQTCFGASWLVLPLLALAIAPLARPGRRDGAWLLAVTGLPIALLCYALSLKTGGLFVERYMYFLVPGFVVLVAAGIEAVPGPAILRVGLALVLVALGGRALALRPPHAEAAHLAEASSWLALHAAPEDTVFHAEPHSLLTFRHYESKHGQHQLLMTRDHLPYYDGDLLIPAGWRVTPATAQWPGAAQRAWALVNGYSGVDVARARATFGAGGRAPVATFGEISIWEAGPTVPVAPRPRAARPPRASAPRAPAR